MWITSIIRLTPVPTYNIISYDNTLYCRWAHVIHYTISYTIGIPIRKQSVPCKNFNPASAIILLSRLTLCDFEKKIHFCAGVFLIILLTRAYFPFAVVN